MRPARPAALTPDARGDGRAAGAFGVSCVDAGDYVPGVDPPVNVLATSCLALRRPVFLGQLGGVLGSSVALA
jgi:hypothetical protein